MWPFRRKQPPDTPQTAPEPSYAHRVASLELEMVEIRDELEKVLAAIKKVQGRLLRRAQLAEEQLEKATDPEQLALETQPPPTDRKAALRARAWELRGGHSNVNGG